MKLPLKQVRPRAARAAFEVVAPKKGRNYWRVSIRHPESVDATGEGNLEFELAGRASLGPQRVANAGAGRLQEARGVVHVVKYADGIPILSATYVSNGRHVLCVWSTDQDQAPVEHPLFRRKT